MIFQIYEDDVKKIEHLESKLDEESKVNELKMNSSSL